MNWLYRFRNWELFCYESSSVMSSYTISPLHIWASERLQHYRPQKVTVGPINQALQDSHQKKKKKVPWEGNLILFFQRNRCSVLWDREDHIQPQHYLETHSLESLMAGSRPPSFLASWPQGRWCPPTSFPCLAPQTPSQDMLKAAWRPAICR